MRYTFFRPGTARAGFGGAALALLAALSAGCTSTQVDGDPMQAYDSRLRHPILVSDEPENFNLPVGMRGPALSPQIETALRDYVSEYRSDGTGSITIQVPTGSANAVAAASTGHAVHYALVRAGVPRGQIEVAPYEVGDHSNVASLRISYLRVKAVVPTCGIWPEGQPSYVENVQYENFGCAQQQNLAAMVANPADLLRPRTMTPAHGGRRANVIKIYVDLGNNGWLPEPDKGLRGDALTVRR
jgi:pilus assembly protein CpaD